MKKLLFAAFLPFLLTSFSPLSLSSETRVYKASSKQVMRYYDDTKPLDFTDSTPEEISAYYGDIGSRKGDDLLHYLYTKITPREIQEASNYDDGDQIATIDQKYYLQYDLSSKTDRKAVSAWYQITDRNWEKSYAITPTDFRFLSSTDENAKNLYFYNMYISDASNNDTTKAFSNLTNDLKGDKSTASVDWTNRKRPQNVQVDKEHVWAKNHGFKLQTTFVPGAPSDLHHLVAADHNTNSSGHNDYFYGKVDHEKGKKIYAFLADGSQELSGWNNTNIKGEVTTFEPTDEWKGDIARCLFYMATRYSRKFDKNCQAEPYLYITDDTSYTDDDGDREVADKIFHGVQYNLSTLLEWNKQDPVSDYEKHRNNLIYKNVQNNRNPYVDHPEWVSRVFDKNWNGDTSGDNTSSSTQTSDNNSSKDDTDNPSFSLFGLSEEQSMTVVIVIAVVILIVIILIVLLSQKGKKKRKPYKKPKRKSSSKKK